MSEAHRRRGTRPPKAGPPWSAAEDALLPGLPAVEAARRTGRTPGAVYARRRKLRLPDGRRRARQWRGVTARLLNRLPTTPGGQLSGLLPDHWQATRWAEQRPPALPATDTTTPDTTPPS
jgi:hypothetical protein